MPTGEIESISFQTANASVCFNDYILSADHYLPNCRGQKRAKGLLVSQVKLPPAQYHTHWRIDTVS